jgi:hypothetical protein
MQHQEFHLNIKLESINELIIINGNEISLRQDLLGLLHTNYYYGVLLRPKRRMDLCRVDLREWTSLNMFRPKWGGSPAH